MRKIETVLSKRSLTSQARDANTRVSGSYGTCNGLTDYEATNDRLWSVTAHDVALGQCRYIDGTLAIAQNTASKSEMDAVQQATV